MQGAPPRAARMFRSCLIESSRRASRAGPRRRRRRLGRPRPFDGGRCQRQASTRSSAGLRGGVARSRAASGQPPSLEVLDRGRLLGLSAGGLVPRAFEAPLFFEGLSVVGGLVPRVFEAPLFFEAPPLDVRGLVTRGDGGVEAPLLLGLAPQERHGELEPGPAEGDVHRGYHARGAGASIRRTNASSGSARRGRGCAHSRRPRMSFTMLSKMESADGRVRHVLLASLVEDGSAGGSLAGALVGGTWLASALTWLSDGGPCRRPVRTDDRSAAAAPLAEEEARRRRQKRARVAERPAADAAPRRRVPPRGPRRGLDLRRRLLAGRAELLPASRPSERRRRVADAWRRVRCRFLERGLVRGRVRRLDGLVCLDGLVLLVCVGLGGVVSRCDLRSCLACLPVQWSWAGPGVLWSSRGRREERSSSALDATVSSFAVMV